MQAAFALLVVFPPPAAGALGFTGLDGAGAGFAADRGIATGMQRVDGHRLISDQRVDAVEIPVGERVELDQVPFGIIFGEGRIGRTGRGGGR